MDSRNILFKGTKDGVIVMVKGSGDYLSVKHALNEKLCNAGDFFKGSKLYMDFSNANIGEEEQKMIKNQIMEDYGVAVQDINTKVNRMFTGTYEGRTRFIRSTIRSGQNIEFPGNIVIIGDVNAGSQVVAGGNIIVLGTLRGVVHAGASGNEKGIIAAFSLQPTQLRIAGLISRAPDGEKAKPRCPELARVKDNCIIIEPYAPDKFYD